MRCNSIRGVVVPLGALLCGLIWFYSAGPPADRISNNPAHSATAPMGRVQDLPVLFEPNAGQTDTSVAFLGRGEGFLVYFTADETVFKLRQDGELDSVVRMRLENEAAHHRLQGESVRPSRSNYFTGNDRTKWLTDVPHFGRVRRSGIYPGIDQLFYGNGRRLEYDFVVSPGADPSSISVRFEGVQTARLDESGDLVLAVDGSELRQRAPVIYQNIAGERKSIAGSYAIKPNGSVGFEIGEYDRSRELVIDPVLVYSTYLGGNASDAGRAIAIDSQRNTYITGQTAATNFPTVNPAQPTSGGGTDIFVTKINASGSAIVYSTYIGGSAGEIGHGIDVDAAGSAYVAGVTGGTNGPNNFPTTPGAFDRTFNSPDEAILFKLSPAGNELVYSTYTGASIAREVKVNKLTGEAFVAGAAGSVLPTTPGAFRETCQPTPCSSNGFITKFNSAGSALVYSTYTGPGTVSDLAVDANGDAYVTGSTVSTVFPITPGAAQPTCTGCNLFRSDAFVMRMNSTGSALVYSTYLGGSIDEVGTSIALDQNNNAYVTGRTESSSAASVPFPTTPGAFQASSPGVPDGFVTKVNPTGSTFIYSTYLGGNARDELFGIAVDRLGKAHVIGQTRSNNYPKVNAIQDVCTVNGPCVSVTSLNPAGSAVVFSTYFGQGLGEEVVADNAGAIYITGETYEGLSNLPLMNPIQPAPGAGSSVQDGFVAKIFVESIGSAPYDFDGDGKTDIGIFRPSDATWWIQRSSTNVTRADQFGVGTDRIVPADFTGDGKTDHAVWRPSTGDWFVLRSEDFSFFAFPFGANGDIPAPGDYDNDGRADPAVFRPSNGVWFVQRSGPGGILIKQFGTNGDIPVPADYDGDSRADIAIYRPSNGQWWLDRSASGVIVAQFGLSNDKPVPGDFTGDAKADIAFWRPSTGDWFVLRSEDFSFFAFPFGTTGDVVAPGDYDGDGKIDPTVFRPSNATWYTQRSTGGFDIRQFGTNGDRPIPNAFVP